MAIEQREVGLFGRVKKKEQLQAGQEVHIAEFSSIFGVISLTTLKVVSDDIVEGVEVLYALGAKEPRKRPVLFKRTNEISHIRIQKSLYKPRRPFRRGEIHWTPNNR